MSHNIKELKQRFLEYVEIEKGRSHRTVRLYDEYLNRFFEFAKIKTADDITDEKVRQFRLWLNRLPGWNVKGEASTMKKKTQNYYLIALRSFLKFLSKKGIKALSADAIELAKVGDRHIDLISTDELKRLLDAPKGDDIRILRDKAILELLFSTGLRLAELCSLTCDLDFSAEQLSVRGKGEKIRLVFISDEAKKAIKKYLDKRTDMDEALFVRHHREHSKSGSNALDRRSVERVVKYWAIRAGISKKVTPHVIRHCFATDLQIGRASCRERVCQYV